MIKTAGYAGFSPTTPLGPFSFDRRDGRAGEQRCETEQASRPTPDHVHECNVVSRIRRWPSCPSGGTASSERVRQQQARRTHPSSADWNLCSLTRGSPEANAELADQA